MREFDIREGFPTAVQVPVFVAEIGCNHTGSIDIAKQMIVVAKTCGAQVAKFQKRCPRQLLTDEQYSAPYTNPHSYGRTYGEHRENLEFTVETHRMLKEYAEAHGIDYSTSVWDMTSAREITALKPSTIKVPSPCNNHFEMLEFLRDGYEGSIHLSSGMTTPEELDRAVDIFKSCPDRVVLYACTSAYPAPFGDVCLLEILRLRERYQRSGRVHSIAFSGHHNGIAVDMGAVLLGASHIERHFTLDRAWKGSDHAASLGPGGFGRLTRDARHLAESWAFKSESILPIEQAQRRKLKYRVPAGDCRTS
jgi:N-acetylneuraminate synthase